MRIKVTTVAHLRPWNAFTLLEVVLAIAITLGLLFVVLFFYQQTTRLRTELVDDAEKVSVARLFLERITSELRGAITDEFLVMGLTGGSNSLEFVTTRLPSRAAWTSQLAGNEAISSDLKIVRYQFPRGERTLTRAEEPLVETLLAPALNDESTPAATDVAPRGLIVPLDAIKFIQFRYYDGSKWLQEWNDWVLPQGIEVTVGAEPVTANAPPGDYPHEIFRRVIALPAAGKAVAIDRLDLPDKGALP